MHPNPLSLYEQVSENIVNLTPREFSILQGDYSKYIEIYPTVNRDEFKISTLQYVGCIVLPQHNVILINPKIDNARILLMLNYAFKELKLTDKEISFPENKEFHEILIKILTKRLEDLLQFGVLKSYTEIEENLPYVKGRILLIKQLRHNMILKHKTYCRYPELTQDILENQIIKFTLYHVIKHHTVNEELRKSLIRLFHAFEFVSMKAINLTSFVNLQFNRLNERYKPILTICKILLQNGSVDADALHAEDLDALRTKESFAFLIDMDKLFEVFVREYLRRNLNPICLKVNKGYNRLCYDDEIELKPDIDIKKGNNTVLIIDTKYKILHDKEATRSDVSQVLDYCLAYNIKKLLLEDYDNWADEFIDYSNAVDYRDVSINQKELIFYCSDFQLQELIDVRPKDNSGYIRSSTEPFDDEMELDQRRVKRWLLHFGLLNKESEWNQIHVSGHGSGDQIKRVIEGSLAKKLVPIHTEHEEYHKKWHDNVMQVEGTGSIEL